MAKKNYSDVTKNVTKERPRNYRLGDDKLCRLDNYEPIGVSMKQVMDSYHESKQQY